MSKSGMEATHPLRAWREAKGIKPRQFCDETGLTLSHLSQLEHGKKGLSLSKAVRIERFTNGEVPASALAAAEPAE